MYRFLGQLIDQRGSTGFGAEHGLVQVKHVCARMVVCYCKFSLLYRASFGYPMQLIRSPGPAKIVLFSLSTGED